MSPLSRSWNSDSSLNGAEMEWAKPRYDKREVNWAGRFFTSLAGEAEDEDFDLAVDVIDNFRAAHAFPLNTLQHRLRMLAVPIDPNAIIAQRLKRFLSILDKLERFPMMTLWQMQDIGGCRAIVSDVAHVNSLVEAIKASSIKHKLWHEDDYIYTPRDSGYRSRHLMYSYFSDKSEVFNGLRIEMQVRTAMQHAWATTVETVGTFTKQALKSSQGDEDWKRFFQLMGTWMAMREDTPPVPGTPKSRLGVKRELKACADQLQVEKTLLGFTEALRMPTRFRKRDDSDFYLLSLNNNTETLAITGYRRNELEHAMRSYERVEKRIRNQKLTDAVLVSVSAFKDLRRAYPNYYADTRGFVEELKRAVD